MKIKLITLALIMYPTLLIKNVMAESGGAIAGGGGNAIVCFKDENIANAIRKSIINYNGWIPDEFINSQNIISVEALDLAEAKGVLGNNDIKSSKEFIEPFENESEDDFFNRITSRLTFSVSNIKSTLTFSKEKLSDIRFSKMGFGRIDDISNPEILETNQCLRITILKQVINQYESYLIKDIRFFNLPENIFSKSDRVALSLHEFLYYNARTQLNANSSDQTRNLVRTLFRNKLHYSDLYKSLVNYGDINILNSTITNRLNLILIQDFIKFQSNFLTSQSFKTINKINVTFDKSPVIEIDTKFFHSKKSIIDDIKKIKEFSDDASLIWLNHNFKIILSETGLTSESYKNFENYTSIFFKQLKNSDLLHDFLLAGDGMGRYFYNFGQHSPFYGDLDFFI